MPSINGASAKRLFVCVREIDRKLSGFQARLVGLAFNVAVSLVSLESLPETGTKGSKPYGVRKRER
jgi:hypothetical protein